MAPVNPQTEIQALVNAFTGSEGNSVNERITLVAILGLWIVLEIGTTFTQATPPASMDWIRLTVLYIMGRFHGKNVERLGGDTPDGNGGDGTEE